MLCGCGPTFDIFSIILMLSPFEAHQILGSWPVDFLVLRREAQSTFAQGLHQAKDPAASSSMGNFEAMQFLIRVSYHLQLTSSHQWMGMNEGLGWPCSSATRDDERTSTERTQLYIKFRTLPRHDRMLLCSSPRRTQGTDEWEEATNTCCQGHLRSDPCGVFSTSRRLETGVLMVTGFLIQSWSEMNIIYTYMFM